MTIDELLCELLREERIQKSKRMRFMIADPSRYLSLSVPNKTQNMGGEIIVRHHFSAVRCSRGKRSDEPENNRFGMTQSNDNVEKE